MVLRETAYWAALALGGKLHGASRKSVFTANSPPIGRPFRARAKIAKRTRRGLHMVTTSESLSGYRYGKFQSFYTPVKRSYIAKSGLKLPDYLLEDVEP
jgi:hypothetical protein